MPTIATAWTTAELAKASANAFLATKISFLNAIAEVCEASGADVGQLADILGHDARIGRRGMRPGLGGCCLPKDIRGFMARAGELGAGQALTILREVDAINNRRRERMVGLARQQLDGNLAGKRITVWGAAFKPNTDDIRDSPALAVVQKLHELGAEVTVTAPPGPRQRTQDAPRTRLHRRPDRRRPGHRPAAPHRVAAVLPHRPAPPRSPHRHPARHRTPRHPEHRQLA